MAKKKVIKRKLRIFRLLLFLIIIGIISFLVYFILTCKIKNIIITNNNYLTDDEIIKTAKIENYPSFFTTLNYVIEKRIDKMPLVKSVKVTKELHSTIKIKVKEYKILLEKDNKYILENGDKVDITKIVSVPRLINDVPDKKYKQLLDNLNNVNTDVLGKISEIEYTPNTYDKDRFLLYMNDSNSVYLTLTKFEMINYYDRVLAQLENKHGILYLDSGNHFKIME